MELSIGKMICEEQFINIKFLNTSHLKTSQIRNHPIINNQNQIIGRMTEANNEYIYGFLYSASDLIYSTSSEVRISI